MRALVFLLAGSLLICAACSHEGPKWESERVATINIRDSNFALIRAIQSRSEVDALLGCLENAKRVGDSRTPHSWTHKIDIARDRWLYDAASGEFTVFMTQPTVLRVRRFPWGNDKPTQEYASFAQQDGATAPVGSFSKGSRALWHVGPSGERLGMVRRCQERGGLLGALRRAKSCLHQR